MNRLVFASLLTFSAAASAQTAPSATPAAPAAAAPAVGATVMGKDNQSAGTIAQVTAEAVVIDTGTNKVPVPTASIGTSAKGPTIGMTKAELDAAFTQAAQQAQANVGTLLTSGRMVHGVNDAMLGTIKEADAQFVTVKTAKGEVKLPVAGFAPGANNTVRVGLTAEQLDTALSGAATTSSTAATPEAAPAAEATPAPDATKTPKPAKTPKTPQK